MNITVVILAAGKGSRMDSDLPKVMHEINNKPMIGYLLDLCKELSIKDLRCVIDPSHLGLKSYITDNYQNVEFCYQEKKLGTADAVKQGVKKAGLSDKTLVLYGDTPFLSSKTIYKMYEESSKADLVVLGFYNDKPNSYGRLLVDSSGNLHQIIEYLDATNEQRKIDLCNSGIMLISSKYLNRLLAEVRSNNSKNEYYLTDIVHIANSFGLKCKYISGDANEVIGVNTQAELQEAKQILAK